MFHSSHRGVKWVQRETKRFVNDVEFCSCVSLKDTFSLSVSAWRKKYRSVQVLLKRESPVYQADRRPHARLLAPLAFLSLGTEPPGNTETDRNTHNLNCVWWSVMADGGRLGGWGSNHLQGHEATSLPRSHIQEGVAVSGSPGLCLLTYLYYHFTY